MQRSKYRYFPFVLAGLVIALSLFVFWRTPQVNAQCGSQASSCKNCHEVQGKKPVNNDGTGWHESHAFGDFCYICHAGNSQATDEKKAHTGMVAPLSDVKASCQQCHVDDLMKRAQVYADELGVEIGEGDAQAAAGSEQSSAEQTSEASSSEATTETASQFTVPAASEIDVDDPNLVDYVKRYDEIVLGHHPVNMGNIILLVLIALVAIGGSAFVVYNEGWLSMSEETVPVSGDKYPGDVVSMLASLEKLDDKGRKALKQLLRDPEEASKLFEIIAQQRK